MVAAALGRPRANIENNAVGRTSDQGLHSVLLRYSSNWAHRTELCLRRQIFAAVAHMRCYEKLSKPRRVAREPLRKPGFPADSVKYGKKWAIFPTAVKASM